VSGEQKVGVEISDSVDALVPVVAASAAPASDSEDVGERRIN